MWDLFDFDGDGKTSLFEKVVGIELLESIIHDKDATIDDSESDDDELDDLDSDEYGEDDEDFDDEDTDLLDEDANDYENI